MATSPSRIAPPTLTLDGVVAYWASRAPDARALEFGRGPETSVTYGEFEAFIRRAATRLLGIPRGQVVGLVCNDSLEFHVLLNALWRRGAAVLLISRGWGPAIIDDLLELSGCDLVFSQEWPLRSGARSPFTPFPDLAAVDSSGGEGGPEATGTLDDIALLATTSGTTDDPKCVAITHRQIRGAYASCLAVHDFRGVRRAGSLFAVNGLGVLGVCFLLPREVGASTRVFPAFTLANLRQTWAEVIEGGIDFVYLVPPLVRLLMTLPVHARVGEPVLAFCAAAPVTETELRTLEARQPVRIFNAYGLTELTFAVFFGVRADDDLASGSIGRPIGVAARLRDEAGRLVKGPGEGELEITGPMLTAGYVRNPAATRATWSRRWLRTGDLAERDARGLYFIRGRKKDVAIRGGVLYYFHELEHYLRLAPGVVDACAFRGRDLPSGDELVAVAQAGARLQPDSILAWVRSNIGRDKTPNVLYVITEALPRNSAGKLLRAELAAMHRDGRLAAARAEAEPEIPSL